MSVQPATPPSEAKPPREAGPQEAAGTPRRRKDEPSPPSAWRVLRPGKPVLSAPDGAAWLKWWTDLAGKAAAEGRHGELRTLYEANTAIWDDIALASPETEAVMAKAAQAVRTALDG